MAATLANFLPPVIAVLACNPVRQPGFLLWVCEWEISTVSTQRHHMLHLFNFLHRVFARGGERSTRAFYVRILDTRKNAYLDGSMGGGKERRGSRSSQAAAPGQWAMDTQPGHTWRAG